jgi:transposase-like protein
VDREWLARKLQEGASYEAIAREVRCSPTKVSYWAAKYGFKSAHAGRHGPRGPLDKDALLAMAAAGATVPEMAATLERSPTTIRYWLKRVGQESPAAKRWHEGAIAMASGAHEAILSCREHGPARHVRHENGFRCAECRSAAVSARRRRVKATLLAEAGGRCRLCGYDRCVAALHFHHVDPEMKSFSLAVTGVTRSLAAARAEARKCVVLCANCHAEVESGLVDVSIRSGESGFAG